jgi:hypothetical protein
LQAVAPMSDANRITARRLKKGTGITSFLPLQQQYETKISGGLESRAREKFQEAASRSKSQGAVARYPGAAGRAGAPVPT